MTDIYGIHADGIGQVEAYLGDKCPTFIWNGNVIRILPGSAVRGKDLGEGGFRLRSDLKFVVRVSDLPVPGPALKQTIAYLGQNYRIDTMELFAGDTLQRFACNDPNQAA